MKRLLVVTAIAALSAGTVFAGIQIIPWFNDNGGPVGPNIIPSTGEATYIRLVNSTGGSITLTIDWFDQAGAGAGANTATLAPGNLLAWRPFLFQGITPNGGPASQGTLWGLVSWGGGTNTDIVGNFVTINNNGTRLGVNLSTP